MTDDRELVSVVYDGREVRTPPRDLPGRHWTISAQCEQASEHREHVRWLLSESRMRRLGASCPPSKLRAELRMENKGE